MRASRGTPSRGERRSPRQLPEGGCDLPPGGCAACEDHTASDRSIESMLGCEVCSRWQHASAAAQ
eukprot:889121-Prymnesium_polylepis.2